jgi:6-phosphofructokinase 1
MTLTNPQFPDFSTQRLGETRNKSPIALGTMQNDGFADFVRDDQRVAYGIEVSLEQGDQTVKERGLLEKAGPRELIYFDPSKVHAAIVTCGGLCPGLNNVIRATVMTLWYRYGVRRISGIRYGYRGLLPEQQLPVKELTPEAVSEVHRFGGTMLGSSRVARRRRAHRGDRRRARTDERQHAVRGGWRWHPARRSAHRRRNHAAQEPHRCRGHPQDHRQ